MPASYICDAAKAMAATMLEASVPMYGAQLRLPDRKAIIVILKETRRLMFPAYFGDPALMSLSPADYSALLLDRIESALTAQIALALPAADAQRAPELACEIIMQFPAIQKQLLTDIDAIFDGDPAAQNKEEIIFSYPGLFAIFAYRVAHELYLRHRQEASVPPRSDAPFRSSVLRVFFNEGAFATERSSAWYCFASLAVSFIQSVLISTEYAIFVQYAMSGSFFLPIWMIGDICSSVYPRHLPHIRHING